MALPLARPGQAENAAANRVLRHFFPEDFDAVETVVAPEPPPPPPAPVEPPELVPYFTEQELQTARRDGYEAGAADRRAATLEAHEAALEQSMAAIAASLSDAQSSAERVAEAVAENVARLLLRLLATQLPAWCGRHGAAEIDAVIGAVLPQLKTEPRVVVEVNPANADGVRARLSGLAPELTARVELSSTEAVAEGDVRIHWQDGDAVRDAAATWREIAAILQPLGLLDATDEAAGGSAAAGQCLIRENADVD